MGGKSTFLRQNALIAILAQIGSFVPAESAHIGVIDAVYTRIGASDNLTKDQSTFMVEMIEISGILQQATDRSLVIVDEIGRGTSTEDGSSLAYAIARYLYGRKCKVLFATHYHDLIPTNDEIKCKFYQTEAYEDEKGDFFPLHRIIPGIAIHSHGIAVAKLAGKDLKENINSRYTFRSC
jgi:DNA mismatch repair protein MutS